MNGCYNTMGIGRVRRSAGVAVCVLALGAAFVPGLTAQGAKETTGRGRAGAPAARPTSHLQPARGMLVDLVGTWRLEVLLAGDLSGKPRGFGLCVVETLVRDLRPEM